VEQGLRRHRAEGSGVTQPVISVIVPVWNDEKRIGQCIEALQSQSLPREAFEIIVVDNGSTDSTSAVVARYQDVLLLREATAGSYAARNTGLARARGDYVAFTDSDCTPQPDWLEKGLQAVRDQEGIGVGAGRVAFQEPHGHYSRACLNYERHLSMRQDENARKGFAITANWFSRKSILLEAGGFNAALKSGGDYALSGKLSRSGLRTVYLHDAVVQHPARAQVAEITGKIRRVVGGRWASETGKLRSLKRGKVETKSFLKRLQAVARAPGLSLVERLEVMALVFRIWLVSLLELLRLQLGKAPARS
jgi:glycosyltransferase involved in cell wall biosynthesis